MLKVKERTQQEIRNQISKIVKAEGYNAMAEEIKNDRKPKANVTFFIQSRYESRARDLRTDEQETKKTVEELNKDLKPNSAKKLKFFDVLNDFSNLHAEYWKVATKMDEAKDSKEWEKLYKENDGIFDKMMQLEYELGNFVK